MNVQGAGSPILSRRIGRRTLLIASAAGMPSLAACAAPLGIGATELYSKEAVHGAHWGYDGDVAPAHWAELDHSFAACATGSTQSPIDITPAKTMAADWLDRLQVKLAPTKLHLVNNGHTIQVNYDPGSTFLYEKRTYKLAQFHFHTPSEHLINGRAGAMELHAVFQDIYAPKRLAVIGVLLQESAQDNPLLARFWHALPEKEAKLERELELNVAESMPSDPHYWAYDGSLTTPPCSEQVSWIVMRQSMPVSPAQLAKFRAIFPHNARPVQPIKDRLIKTY